MLKSRVGRDEYYWDYMLCGLMCSSIFEIATSISVKLPSMDVW